MLTGNKRHQKIYYYHTGYPGDKAVNYADLLANRLERAVYLAVKRMLPNNRLGRAMLKKLKIYRDDQHPHQAQQPVIWEEGPHK